MVVKVVLNIPGDGYSNAKVVFVEREFLGEILNFYCLRRGLSQSTTAGPLCLWQHRREADRRRDDEFNSFESFRNSLQPPARDCAGGNVALLEVILFSVLSSPFLYPHYNKCMRV